MQRQKKLAAREELTFTDFISSSSSSSPQGEPPRQQRRKDGVQGVQDVAGRDVAEEGGYMDRDRVNDAVGAQG